MNPLMFDMTDEKTRKSIVPKTENRIIQQIAEMQQKYIVLVDEIEKSRGKERLTIFSPSDAAYLLMPYMSVLQVEEMHVILCNTRSKVIGISKIYQGTINRTPVRIAEVLRPAIMRMAHSIALVHNHPSGDPTPSPDDVAVTRSVIQASKLFDIELLDHIVIGGGNYVSLKERGLGFG
jgi:DNA repair protein RadC